MTWLMWMFDLWTKHRNDIATEWKYGPTPNWACRRHGRDYL